MALEVRMNNVGDGYVQSCCFANINQLVFLPFSLPSPPSLPKLPILLLRGEESGRETEFGLSCGSILQILF